MSGNAAHHDKQWCCDDECADFDGRVPDDERESAAGEVNSRETSERSRTRSQGAIGSECAVGCDLGGSDFSRGDGP